MQNDGRGRHGNHLRGSAHPKWNDGRIVSGEGYVKIRVGIEHPLADPNGYTYEHLVVWVSAGNPPPLKTQLLHHKDEDRENNRIGNLELKTRSRHNAEHNAKRFSRPVLTEDAVVAIRHRRAAGEELKAIAHDYGISNTTVSNIAHRKCYAGVV